MSDRPSSGFEGDGGEGRQDRPDDQAVDGPSVGDRARRRHEGVGSEGGVDDASAEDGGADERSAGETLGVDATDADATRAAAMRAASADTDPARALGYLDQMAESEKKIEACSEVAGVLAAYDPDRALAAVDRIPGGQDAAYSELASRLAENGHRDQAVEALDRVVDEGVKADSAGELLRSNLRIWGSTGLFDAVAARVSDDHKGKLALSAIGDEGLENGIPFAERIDHTTTRDETYMGMIGALWSAENADDMPTVHAYIDRLSTQELRNNMRWIVENTSPADYRFPGMLPTDGNGGGGLPER